MVKIMPLLKALVIRSTFPLGKPDSVKNCLISNRSLHSVLLECSPGKDNGLQQTFYLRVFERVDPADVEEAAETPAAPDEELVAEMRNGHYPYFTVDNLSPDARLRFVVYSKNQKVGFVRLFVSSGEFLGSFSVCKVSDIGRRLSIKIILSAG